MEEYCLQQTSAADGFGVDVSVTLFYSLGLGCNRPQNFMFFLSILGNIVIRKAASQTNTYSIYYKIFLFS